MPGSVPPNSMPVPGGNTGGAGSTGSEMETFRPGIRATVPSIQSRTHREVT